MVVYTMRAAVIGQYPKNRNKIIGLLQMPKWYYYSSRKKIDVRAYTAIPCVLIISLH